jgi:hypothetical protein
VDSTRSGVHVYEHVVAACGVGVKPAVVVRISLQVVAQWPGVGCATPNQLKTFNWSCIGVRVPGACAGAHQLPALLAWLCSLKHSYASLWFGCEASKNRSDVN